MDTSKTYIKMCEKAEEIQKIFRGKGVNKYSEDIYKCTSPDGGCMARGFNGLDACDKCEYNTVWLPRQDQIQEMVGSKTAELIDNFYWFCINEARNSDGYMDCIHDGDPEKIDQKSMEQLWLSFVMKEKYQKTWDSEKEEWVK